MLQTRTVSETLKYEAVADKAMKSNSKGWEVTKEKLFLVFLIFFFIFMLAGYFRGRAVRKGRDNLLPIIESRLQIAQEAEGIVIVYNCPKKPIYYYIDADRIENRDLTSELPRKESASYLSSIFGDDVLFKSFLGGATAWTVKDVFHHVTGAESEAMAGSRMKYVAVAFIGAVTGYGIGYTIGVSGQPECDSADIDPLLRDKENWKNWEKIFWQSARQNVMGLTSTLLSSYRLSDHEKQKSQDQLIKDAMRRLDQVDRRAVVEGYDFTTADFDVLLELSKAKEDYMKVYDSQSGSHLK